ncbi:MAG: DNA primase [Clostridia bacterium]|nr:DNA primase [Clostridia bacterium]
MPMFPDAWMAELLSRNDIVSVVSEYVRLSAKGRRMWGCCPFHHEKTPSFSVTGDKQLYYCFGCHAGGSVVQFVMEMEKLQYTEAIKFLAQRVGMELPNDVDDEKLKNERAKKERLYAACKEAARFYHECLLSNMGKEAKEYLAKRGLDAKTVKRFGLGYAPDSWDSLLLHLKEKGFTENEIKDAGLALSGKKEGSCYDTYRNRVIFPIIAPNSRVLGFGARIMGKGEPKYLNTGDTLIFNKRNNLYAINMQKGKQINDILIVEGYMDVISLYKHGVENAVASLGTALTQQQARLIKRYTNKVYICYDGDAAGQNAMLRGLDILAKEELKVRVVVIPGGLDPDEYVRKNGKDAFESLKDKALTLPAYKLLCIERACDLNTDEDREEYAKKACAYVSTIEPVEKERCISQIARKSGLSRETIMSQCGATKSSKKEETFVKRGNRREKKDDESVQRRLKAERMMVAYMSLSKDNAMYVMEKMAQEDVQFENEAFTEYADALLMEYSEKDVIDEARLLSTQSASVAEAVLPALQLSDELSDSSRDIIEDCMKTMQADAIRARILEIMNGADAQMPDFAERLMEAEKLKKQLSRLLES